MPTPFQEQVARIVAGLPETHRFALTGGATLVVTQVADGATRFAPRPEVQRVARTPSASSRRRTAPES